jgi:hypothetical protein
MSEISTLSKLIRMRMYDQLEREVEKQIQKSSWLKVTERLRTIWNNAQPAHVHVYRSYKMGYGLDLAEFSNSRYYGTAYNVPVGKIRDALINILDLEPVTGIDIDLLEAFTDVEGQDLYSIRNEVRSKSLEILSNQVKRGDTFLLDIDDMAISPFHGLVKEIIETRKSEVLDIGEKPHIKEIVSTYYGFSISVEGCLETKEIGIREDTKSVFMESVKELGGEIAEVRGKRIRYSPKLFPKCSDEKATLLANILELAISGGGEYYLKDLGDSRPTDLLIRRLVSPAASASRSTIIAALAGIGDSKALDAVRKYAEAKHEIAIGAILALGLIRSPDIVSCLIDMSGDLLSSDKELSTHQLNKATAYLVALGKTEEPAALPVLEDVLLHGTQELRFAALTGLVVFGTESSDSLKNQIDVIIEMILTTDSFHMDKVLSAVFNEPELMNRSDVIDAIVKRIQPQSSLVPKIASYYERYEKVEMPAPVLDALKKSPRYQQSH